MLEEARCKHGKVDQKNAPVYIFGQRPKNSSKAFFNWFSFHDDLYCCVEYTTVENQVEIFNTYHLK
jgi:hypothetical protein